MVKFLDEAKVQRSILNSSTQKNEIATRMKTKKSLSFFGVDLIFFPICWVFTGNLLKNKKKAMAKSENFSLMYWSSEMFFRSFFFCWKKMNCNIIERKKVMRSFGQRKKKSKKQFKKMKKLFFFFFFSENFFTKIVFSECLLDRLKVNSLTKYKIGSRRRRRGTFFFFCQANSELRSACGLGIRSNKKKKVSSKFWTNKMKKKSKLKSSDRPVHFNFNFALIYCVYFTNEL